jgi:hypothetical protein
MTVEPKPANMPEGLERALGELDMTNRDLGRLCGVVDSTVQRWLNGSMRIPLPVARLVALMVLMRRMQAVFDSGWGKEQTDAVDGSRSRGGGADADGAVTGDDRDGIGDGAADR